jgi:hypothetical protein
MNLDAHAHAPESSSPSVSPTPSSAQCVQGVECYISSVRLTIGATFLGLLLGLLAAVRDRRKFADVKSGRPEDVVWEAEED